MPGKQAVLFVLVLLSCTATAACGRAKRGGEQLTITARGGELGERRFTLGCDPARGTVPRPSAACATLRADPDALEAHSGRDHSCPGYTPTYEIKGTSGGEAVAVSFSPCVSGQDDGFAVWTRLVPYDALVLHGSPTLKLDAGVGPLRLGQRVEAVEHGTGGQLLGETRVAYRLADHGVLVTHYNRDLRIDRIEPAFNVERGKADVLRWPHYACRPGQAYRHTTGAKWTAVLVAPGEPSRDWRVIVGAGAAPRTCDALGLA